MGSRRWDGDAGPFLFAWDTEGPELTAVGRFLGWDALKRHSATALTSLSAVDAGGTGNFRLLPKKPGAAPQGTAPSACSVSSQPPGRAVAIGKGSASSGAGGSDKDSPIFGIHEPLDQLSCTVYRFSLVLHLWSETHGRRSSLLLQQHAGERRAGSNSEPLCLLFPQMRVREERWADVSE